MVRVGVVGKVKFSVHGFETGKRFVAELFVRVNEKLLMEFTACIRVACFLVLAKGGNTAATIVSVATKASGINTLDFLLILNRTPKLAVLYSLFSNRSVAAQSANAPQRLIIPRRPFCRARFWAVVFSRQAATENSPQFQLRDSRTK